MEEMVSHIPMQIRSFAVVCNVIRLLNGAPRCIWLAISTWQTHRSLIDSLYSVRSEWFVLRWCHRARSIIINRRDEIDNAVVCFAENQFCLRELNKWDNSSCIDSSIDLTRSIGYNFDADCSWLSVSLSRYRTYIHAMHLIDALE